MKNFKGKALAFALAGSMVFSSMTTAFANEVTSVNKLGILQSLNVFQGNGSDDENYGSTEMQRYQNFIMLLRLQGLEDDMTSFQVEADTDNFADAATLNNYQARLAAFLKNNPDLGVTGYTDGTLKPYQNITAKEYLKTMLESLGYEYGVDFTWSGDTGVLAMAESTGLIADASAIDGNAQITVEEAAGFTYDALATAPKGETVTLGEKIGKPVVTTANITLDEIAPTATSGMITVSGTATGLDAVTVNGEEVAVVDGEFETTVSLVNGDNTITVAGEGVEAQTVTVSYNDVDAPEVVSVQALGLKQVEVVFNESLDEDTAEDEDNYEGFASAELQSDRKTVVLTLATAKSQNTELEFDIDNIKDVNGNEMDKVTKKISMVDRDIPEVSEVKVVGNQLVKVTFSELVQAEKADFEVVDSDGEVAERIDDISIDGRTVEVNLRKVLPAGDYTFKIADVEDYAGFVMYDVEFDITVVEDENAPTAEFISATDTEVVVEFNEDFKTNLKDITAEWESGSKSGKFDATLTEADDDNGQLVTFKLANGNTLPLSGATIKIYDVEDYFGNEVDEDNAIEITVDRYDIELDTTRPEIQSYEQDGTNTIVITFSEDVTDGDIDVYDEDGEKVSSSFSIDGTDKNEVTVVLNDSSELAGTYTVEVSKFKDTSTNTNELIPEIFDIELTDDELTSDITKYKAKFVTSPVTEQAILIQYPEKMDENTVENEANYKVLFNNKWLTVNSDADLDLLDDEKTIKISFADWFDNDDITAAAIEAVQIQNIADANGNELDGTIWIQSSALDQPGSAKALQTTAPSISAAKATDNDKVVLSVTGEINANTIDEDDFYFENTAGDKFYVDAVSYSSDDDELTLTMEDELPSDLTNITFHLLASNELSTANVFDLKVTNSVGSITDEIQPELTVAGAVYEKATPGAGDIDIFGAAGAYVVFEADEALKFLGTEVSSIANNSSSDRNAGLVADSNGSSAEQLLVNAFEAKLGSDDLEIASVFAYEGTETDDTATGYKYNKDGKQYIALYIVTDASEDWIDKDVTVTFNDIDVASFTITDAQDNVLADITDADAEIE